MSDAVQELARWRDQLSKFAEEFDAMPEVAQLNAGAWEKARRIGKSASGSWLGYHAYVYYKDFEPPPPGVHFDVENGTGGTYFSAGNSNWLEQPADAVWDAIFDGGGTAALDAVEIKSAAGAELLSLAIPDISSILTIYLATHADSFVKRLSEEIEGIKVAQAIEIAQDRSPKRQVITYDLKAVQQGTWVPPHVRAEARITGAQQPAAHCRALAKKIDKLTAHLGRAQKRSARDTRLGTNVFIGHGRSPVWRDLKDFVRDRLRLPHDEFNRVPVAGITNIARLSEMLDAAACAFVMMTAEDELADGKAQARMNVIHEVGLFQGRLGFTKAIVLLEDGCEEFSNIQGLGQIRFPKGNVSAKFEEIRQVLEREGVLDVLRSPGIGSDQD